MEQRDSNYFPTLLSKGEIHNYYRRPLFLLFNREELIKAMTSKDAAAVMGLVGEALSAMGIDVTSTPDQGSQLNKQLISPDSSRLYSRIELDPLPLLEEKPYKLEIIKDNPLQKIDFSDRS